jgi:flavodoxin
MPRHKLSRRTLLHIGAAGLAGSALVACTRASRSSGIVSGRAAGATLDATSSSGSTEAGAPQRGVLLVFFSRAGENYFNGGRKNLTVGNTEVAADMIRDTLQCESYKIEPREPYSDSYDDTVQRNVREQNSNARPEIIEPLDSIASYDTIIIGSPIWNVRAPRIILTFVERFDFAGKTVYPFCTYAVSGLGNIVDEYTAACRGAKIGKALAVRGEEVDASRSSIADWLREIGQLG